MSYYWETLHLYFTSFADTGNIFPALSISDVYRADGLLQKGIFLHRPMDAMPILCV
jgi:hypothetical protein